MAARYICDDCGNPAPYHIMGASPDRRLHDSDQCDAHWARTIADLLLQSFAVEIGVRSAADLAVIQPQTALAPFVS